MIRFSMTFAICVSLASSLIAQSVPDCTLKDKRVERLIASKVRELHGAEYCQFRKYFSIIDIDGDNKDDFVVLFSVEGANGNMGAVHQFMYVFLSSRPADKPLQAQVGSRGAAMATTILPTSGRIDLQMDVWNSNDALCCPSGSDTLRFSVTKEQLSRLPQSK